jgi:hypothetical protein
LGNFSDDFELGLMRGRGLGMGVFVARLLGVAGLFWGLDGYAVAIWTAK